MPDTAAPARPADPAPRLDMARLWALARPELRLLVPGTVALLVGTGTNLIFPLLLGTTMDDVLQGGDPAVLDRAAMGLVAIFLVVGVATGLRAWLFTVAGERVVARLRQQLFASFMSQEIAFFDERKTGELTNRLASDTTVLQNAVTVNVSMALRFLLSGLGALGVLFWISWKLTLVMLAVVPVVAVTAGIYGRGIQAISRQVQDALADSSSIAEEALSGVRTVRAFAAEGHENQRYGTAVERSFSLARRRAGMSAGFRGTVTFAGYGAIAAVLWFGGTMLLDGVLTVGDLTSFLMYTLTVAVAVGTLSNLWEDFAKARGASERVFALMDRRPAMQGVAGERPAAVTGEVVLEDVDFAYPSRPEEPVLQGLSLRLEPGRVVALVGPSGSGKSTVAALLSRFYDPGSGAIRLDGRDLRELDPSWLREQVGVVSQEPMLFACSIAENIRYGRPYATDEEVREAARAANAHDFIEGFAEGYETLVGERGVRLSGGQKQRVAIARALLKDPRVLILDEATSALDAESEHLVQEALDRLMVGRTTLVIAHRLSTVKDADRVVVLDGGIVQEQGDHESLLASGGLYQKLVARQFAGT
jgi:ATP-binding cassette subfamily B protein